MEGPKRKARPSARRADWEKTASALNLAWVLFFRERVTKARAGKRQPGEVGRRNNPLHLYQKVTLAAAVNF